MSTLSQIQKDQIESRKNRATLKSNILTCLLSDLIKIGKGVEKRVSELNESLR